MPFSHPANIVRELPLKTGDKVADFGSGSGYYSVEVAKEVGSTGKVLAFDVVPEACEATQARARDAGVRGIVEVKRANLEEKHGTGLADASVDGVIVANILFQSKAKEAILNEAVRILKPGGWLVIIEWDRRSPFASSLSELLEPNEAEALMNSRFGCVASRRFRPDPHHWAILFTKSQKV